jgi:hypothetical protein
VKCEEIRQLLPDHVLGTLSETESAAIRRHIRGCASCRAEAAELDAGVALFARAAHAADPPTELKDRVLAVLEEEWAEASSRRPERVRPRFSFGWQAVAALLVVLIGVATWAGIAQGNASRFHEDAASYRAFLGALGGKDVRVGPLDATGGLAVEGSAVVYDSDRGQSWVLVLARSPGYADEVTVSLEGSGHSINLPFPMKFDADGDGAAWMVTAADLSGFDRVILRDSAGHVIAEVRTLAAEIR